MCSTPNEEGLRKKQSRPGSQAKVSSTKKDAQKETNPGRRREGERVARNMVASGETSLSKRVSRGGLTSTSLCMESPRTSLEKREANSSEWCAVVRCSLNQAVETATERTVRRMVSMEVAMGTQRSQLT